MTTKDKIITSYESLLSKGEVSSIHDLKRKIYLNKFYRNFFLPLFCLKIQKEFNLALRQKLCITFLNTRFNSEVLISRNFGKSTTFCTPNEWLSDLSDFCKVNKISTRIKFYFNILLYGIKSILIGAEWMYSLFKYNKFQKQKLKPYVVFHDLLYSNLPILGNDNSVTIIDWYLKYSKKNYIISHNLKKSNYKYGETEIVEEFSFISCISFIKKIQLFLYFIYIILLSIVLFAFGRWEYLFMSSDILKSKFYQDVNPNLLANEYLFSYSNLDYRPLWTYVVTRRGSNVTFWAYASSLSGIKKTNGEYTFTDYAWEISTWPTILVFTKEFKQFVENTVLYRSKVILTSTPIANTDNILPKILFNKISNKIVISVFDVSPVSDINAAMLLHDPRYRTFKNAKLFLTGIFNVFNDEKFIIIFKVKRPIKNNNFFDKSYIDYIESLSKSNNNIILCHGDISAEKIIRMSNLCISIPFTSTAFIAAMLNIESIFYDGSGMVFSDDRNLQGVGLISGEKQLTEFKNSKFK